LTLIATDFACLVLFNPIRALSALHDSIWAAFFAANIHFARIGTNYFASAAPPSPFQHFWSLAVEEQFYLIWPALLMVVVYGFGRASSRARRLNFRLRKENRMKRITVVLATVVLASFVWSVIETSHNPAAAYFSTFTRIWELGIGALLFVSKKQILRLPTTLRSGATWIGLIGILAAAFLYNANTAIPGFAAALPVLGAALIIAGGIDGGPLSAAIILGRQPFVFVGDVSYTFYLWHWPALVVSQEYVGHALPALSNLLLLVLAFALSVLTYRFYENPIRRGVTLNRQNWAFLWLWATSLMSVVLLASLSGSALTSELAAQELPTGGSDDMTPTTTQAIAPTSTQAISPATRPIENASGGPPETQEASTSTTSLLSDPYVAAVAASVTPSNLASPVPGGLSPAYQNLADDIPHLGPCLASGTQTSTQICHLGDTNGRTLVVFGDSHAQMWMSPLTAYAKSNGWDLVPVIKQACGIDDGDASGTCQPWTTWALSEISQLKPAAIVVIQQYSQPLEEGQAPPSQGLEAEIGTLLQSSPKVLVFEDTPALLFDPTDCLLAGNARLGNCTVSGTRLAELNAGWQSLVTGLGANFVQTLQWFCYKNICPAVIGHTIAYMDKGHISNTYASELAPPLTRELDQFLG